MKSKMLQHHCFTGMLSCFLLGSALILLFVEGKPSGTVVALLLANSLTLTFMLIRILIFPQQEPRLILADCNENGIPVKIYEVCAADLLNFCRSEYDLIFRMNLWKRLYPWLQKRSDAQKDRYFKWVLFFQDEPAILLKANDEAIFAEYLKNGYPVRELFFRYEMPTLNDLCIHVIRKNQPDVKIFRSARELVEWGIVYPENKRELVLNKINDFLRQSVPL